MKTETNAAHPIRHRVFTVIGIILCVILIPIIIINCTLIIKQFTDKDKVLSIGGTFPMIVLTDSMKGTLTLDRLLSARRPNRRIYKLAISSASTIRRVMEQ